MGVESSREVLVAGDDESRAELIELVRELDVAIHAVASGRDVLAAADPHRHALILLAVDVESLSAFEVVRRLRQRYRNALPIAMVSAAAAPQLRDEVAAFLLGADEFFTRPLQPDRFLVRVQRLIEAVGPPRPDHPPAEAALRTLTPRENQILAMLSDGRRPVEIADALCITRKTVATHIERILGKLGVHTQAQAVAVAFAGRAPVERRG